MFIYNLMVIDDHGHLHEHWEGLQLRAVAGRPVAGPWRESLLGNFLERRIQELLPGTSISVALLRGSDAKLEVSSKHAVSASHSGHLTLAVANPSPVGCDIQHVMERSTSEWIDLLGKNRHDVARMIALNANENESTSATRVWAATESLRKLGADLDSPLHITANSTKSSVRIVSGKLGIATFVLSLKGEDPEFIVAVAAPVNDQSTILTSRLPVNY